MTDPGADERLARRLRDLALVEVDALLAGADGALLEALADDLVDALVAARARAAELTRDLAAPDPLTPVAADRSLRLRDGGHETEARVARGLSARARAAATLARLDELAARVVPRLFEVERRIGR